MEKKSRRKASDTRAAAMRSPECLSPLTSPELESPPDPVVYLTKRDCQLIQQTWGNIPNQEELGVQIHRQVFIQCRSIKDTFRFRDVPDEQLQGDEAFMRQVNIFIGFVGAVVKAVAENDERNVDRLALFVGVRHAQLLKIPFPLHWWQVFMDAILHCVRPHFPTARLVSSASNTSRFDSSHLLSPPSRGSRGSISARDHSVGPMGPFRTGPGSNASSVSGFGSFGGAMVQGMEPVRAPAERAWTILLDHVTSIMREGFERCLENYILPPSSQKTSVCSQSQMTTSISFIDQPGGSDRSEPAAPMADPDTIGPDGDSLGPLSDMDGLYPSARRRPRSAGANSAAGKRRGVRRALMSETVMFEEQRINDCAVESLDDPTALVGSLPRKGKAGPSTSRSLFSLKGSARKESAEDQRCAIM